MAIKSTVFKIQLSVSDISRNYYADHTLTVARHPSETDQRMVLRLVAFALNAHEHLQFTKGMSSADEPDLWQIDLTGATEHWIELGQPTEKRLRQSAGKAKRVTVYPYSKGAVGPWYDGVKDTVERFKHLAVTLLTFNDEGAVEQLVDRSMKLSCVIEDDEVLLSNDDVSVGLALKTIKAASR